MNNLFRKYNQNRKTIWAVIIIVAFFVILLQVIFGLIRSSKQKMWQQLAEETNKQLQNGQANGVGQENQVQQTNTVPSNNSSSYIKEQYRKTAQNIINQFAQYCNQNQIEEAYNMLTDDCKQVLFPTINDFKQNYVNQVFSEKRTAKVEQSMYEDGIYRVTYAKDLLASGGYAQEGTLQDYVKLEQTGNANETKISLKEFLQKETFNNKETTTNSIYMKAMQKQEYINYEIYKIQITNQSNQTILISAKEKNNAVHLIDQKEVEYPSNIDEQAVEKLIVKPQATTILELKFNKMYNTNRKTKAIRFTDVITNYNQYKIEGQAEKVQMAITL